MQKKANQERGWNVNSEGKCTSHHRAELSYICIDEHGRITPSIRSSRRRTPAFCIGVDWGANVVTIAARA